MAAASIVCCKFTYIVRWSTAFSRNMRLLYCCLTLHPTLKNKHTNKPHLSAVVQCYLKTGAVGSQIKLARSQHLGGVHNGNDK